MVNSASMGRLWVARMPDLPAFVHKVARGWKMWRYRQETVGALASLSDAQLKDIGVSRGEAFYVAAQTNVTQVD